MNCQPRASPWVFGWMKIRPERAKALGISGISTKESWWIARDANGKPLSQTDLIIERADHTVNLCEIKFYGTIFKIDKKYDSMIKTTIRCEEKGIDLLKLANKTFHLEMKYV